jgi:hypothetical protein
MLQRTHRVSPFRDDAFQLEHARARGGGIHAQNLAEDDVAAAQEAA